MGPGTPPWGDGGAEVGVAGAAGVWPGKGVGAPPPGHMRAWVLPPCRVLSAVIGSERSAWREDRLDPVRLRERHQEEERDARGETRKK